MSRSSRRQIAAQLGDAKELPPIIQAVRELNAKFEELKKQNEAKGAELSRHSEAKSAQRAQELLMAYAPMFLLYEGDKEFFEEEAKRLIKDNNTKALKAFEVLVKSIKTAIEEPGNPGHARKIVDAVRVYSEIPGANYQITKTSLEIVGYLLLALAIAYGGWSIYLLGKSMWVMHLSNQAFNASIAASHLSTLQGTFTAIDLNLKSLSLNLKAMTYTLTALRNILDGALIAISSGVSLILGQAAENVGLNAKGASPFMKSLNKLCRDIEAALPQEPEQAAVAEAPPPPAPDAP